jgi:hypothetical protein
LVTIILKDFVSCVDPPTVLEPLKRSLNGLPRFSKSFVLDILKYTQRAYNCPAGCVVGMPLLFIPSALLFLYLAFSDKT